MTHKANYEAQQVITVFASGAIDRGIAAVIGSNGKITAAGAGVAPNVITMSDATYDGEAIAGAIPNGGIVLMKAGAAIAVGAEVAVNASGKAVAAVSDDKIIGTTTTAAAAADEFVAVQFTPLGTKA